MSRHRPAWHVRRTGGLLVPGFTKRFDRGAGAGVTYWLGVPIGRFDLVMLRDGTTELRYRRWPIVDVLQSPPGGTRPIPAAGYVRLPGGGRRARFCAFELEPHEVD